MIEFDVVVETCKNVKCSLKEFMRSWYIGCALDWDDENILLIYTHAVTQGNMQYIFEVPMIKGYDLDNKDDVERIIRKGYKNE